MPKRSSDESSHRVLSIRTDESSRSAGPHSMRGRPRPPRSTLAIAPVDPNDPLQERAAASSSSPSSSTTNTPVMSVTGFLRRMLRYVRPYWLAALVIFAGLLLEMMFSGLVPMSFKFLIDEALPPKSNRPLLLSVLGGLTVGVVVVSAVGLYRDYLYAKTGARVINDIRFRMFAHLQELSMDFYARAQVGDIVSRFSGDLAAVEQAISAAVPWAILPLLDLLLSTGLMFWLDWRLALVAMLVWPLCLVGPGFFTPRATVASFKRRQDEAATITAVQETMGAQATVKVFNLQKPSLKDFTKRLSHLSASMVRVGFLSSLVDRSAGIGMLMLQVVIMGGGAYLCFEGQLTLGSLVSFQTLFTTMSVSLLYVIQYVPNLVQGAGGLARVEELLGEKPLVADEKAATKIARFAKEIALDHVVFGYTAESVNLDQLSFTIKRGESVAFVGPSGSGKSTVLNLLTRFYDPRYGSVTIDGKDLRFVTQESWRAQIAVVFQESFLFNTSIRENIRMSRPEATDAEVEEAAKAAEIHDFIETQPEKYDTVVGERGGRLSGGQRQRVAIARALLRDPPVLFLDEATSALDAGAETAINATLEQAGKGRTVISITHRLASVVNADRVFVLDQGRLVEHGPHSELVTQGGVYQELWEKQSGFIVTVSDDNNATPQFQAHIEAQRLKAIPFLRSLDDAALTNLAKLFVTERYAAGRKVFAEGHPGERFYVIVRGSVVATKKTPEDEERQLNVIEDGDYFGEIALLENRPRTATIRTRSECLFLTLQREHFLRFLEEKPDVRAEFEKVMRERLEEQQRALFEAAVEDAGDGMAETWRLGVGVKSWRM